MAVRVTLPKKNIERIPSNEGKNKILSALGFSAVAKIKMRTARGIDVNNSSFKPYAKMTKIMREAKGRQTSIVDLRDTGQMLASLTSKVEGQSAVIYFLNFLQSKKASKNQKTRKFFGLSQTDKDELFQEARTFYLRGFK